MITLRSVYNPRGAPCAKRLLVERQLPQDPDSPAMHFEGSLKDIAPSDDLRAWFGNDHSKWQEFRKRYFAELDSHPENWRSLLDAARDGVLELLYNTHDTRYNNAVALKEYLESKLFAVSQLRRPE